MSGTKRGRKAALRARPEREGRERRVQNLLGNVREYYADGNFDGFAKKFREASTWSEQHFKLLKASSKANPFADPLAVAEYLVTTGADRCTLLTSQLYPTLSPLQHGLPVNLGQLTRIRHSFGDNVGDLTRRTVSLAALERLPLRRGAKQTETEQINQYCLMAMQIAEEPDVIKIRGANRLIRILSFLEAGQEAFSRREAEYSADETKRVLARIAYRIGLGKLSYDLLDAVARYEDPIKHARIQNQIRMHDDRVITDEEMQEVQEIIGDYLANVMGIDRSQFSIETRIKSVVSSSGKADRKADGHVEALIDRFALRIVVKADHGQSSDFNFRTLSERDRSSLRAKLQKTCFQIYGGEHSGLAEKFGQYNQDADWQRFFAGSNSSEWFDDYINNPKPNGYSALHDRFLVRTSRGFVPIEIQCLDEISHDQNTNGPSSHAGYKANLAGDVIQEWFNNAAGILRGQPSQPKFVLVYDQMNQIKVLSGEATAASFARIAGMDLRQLRFKIDNDDPFARRDDPTRLYPSDERLVSGDRISFHLIHA